jgi:hypothetical protein
MSEDKSLDVLGMKPIADSVNAVTQGSIDGASAFLSRICLPAAEEFGLLLKDKVSGWRAENAIKITNKAQKMLEKQKNISTVGAHPRIIFSTIENGSWAEDDFMQSFWAGLLASSCTLDGKDESNLIFITVLSQLTSNQVRLINHICETAKIYKSPAGWIGAEGLEIDADDLKSITIINDIHQLDRELDHLRNLGLIRGGFHPHSTKADVTPSAFCLQLYVRAQGYVGSPLDYFGITEEENNSQK